MTATPGFLDVRDVRKAYGAIKAVDGVSFSVGPGEIVGEIAMLDGRGRSATAITLEPSELLVIQRKDFMPFLEQNPKAAIDLIMVLALRLRLNTEQLAGLLDGT